MDGTPPATARPFHSPTVGNWFRFVIIISYRGNFICHVVALRTSHDLVQPVVKHPEPVHGVTLTHLLVVGLVRPFADVFGLSPAVRYLNLSSSSLIVTSPELGTVRS